MAENELGAIVLAAGKGTRMKSDLPKVLHRLGGKPMVTHVTDLVRSVGVDTVCVVIAPGMDSVATAVDPCETAVQVEALGTGHAALAAAPVMDGTCKDVFILFGDTPLITPETLSAMIAAKRTPTAPGVVVLGMQVEQENAYGRLILRADGTLDRIVEFNDATREERAVTLCNSGVMLVDGERLFLSLIHISEPTRP